MQGKWFNIKPKAIELRQQGYSLRDVERILKIPKSTLSGWFKNVQLSEKHRLKLEENRRRSLIKARKFAVLRHSGQREIRENIAKEEALLVLSKLKVGNLQVLELALAMLYFGEGFKKDRTGIGSSDPLILKFFIKSLEEIYKFDKSKIRCELHLRADQNPIEVKRFWMEQLGLPLSSFYKKVSVDKRTLGSVTYPTYNGVCVLNCGNIAIQRRLVYLGKLFCEQLTQEKAVILLKANQASE